MFYIFLPPFTGIRGDFCPKNIHFCHVRIMSERKVCERQTDRQNIYHENEAFSTGEMRSTICAEWMGRWSFWSSIDVNRSYFDENMRENDFYIFFVPSDLDFWPLYLKFAPKLLLSGARLEVSSAFLFRENRIEARDARTDIYGRTTDCWTGCNTYCGLLWMAAYNKQLESTVL